MSDASGDEIHLHNVEELVDEVGAECVATITKIISTRYSLDVALLLGEQRAQNDGSGGVS